MRISIEFFFFTKIKTQNTYYDNELTTILQMHCGPKNRLHFLVVLGLNMTLMCVLMRFIHQDNLLTRKLSINHSLPNLV